MTVKSSRSGKWKKQRLRVLQRDNWICHYCHGMANEVDHIIPKAVDNGPASDEMDNLVAACRQCNLRKGKKNQSVFLVARATPHSLSDSVHIMTQSVYLVGPFEGQEQTQWN